MTLKQATAAQTRRRLIEATQQALRRHGLGGLTLDRVAHEAGVSKGGLLHHFASKDALIEAVLRQLFDDFETRVQHYVEQEPPGRGRWLRAYVRATFEDDPPPLELSALLLVAVTENPALMRLIQEDFTRWNERLLNDGVRAARALVVRQAADSYWSEVLMGVAPTDPTLRQSVRDELLHLINEE
jgi:AcrR family transcriptional regulator